MLTLAQKRTLCVLHCSLALDALFEVSPISRINMNAEVRCSPDKLLSIQMLHAHFQNFVSDHFSSYEEGMRMAEDINQQMVSDITYRSRSVLRNTAVDCISKLMGPFPKYETELDHFIVGYSNYILSTETKRRIGEWFMSKNRSLFSIWNMF